jgi:hypothetical protein
MKRFYCCMLILISAGVSSLAQPVIVPLLNGAPFTWPGSITMQNLGGAVFTGTNATATVTEEIRFVNATVQLTNVTLKCRTLTFANTVNNIFISGNVNFDCESIYFENAAGTLTIDKLNTNPCKLTMEIKQQLNYNGRTIAFGDPTVMTVKTVQKQ